MRLNPFSRPKNAREVDDDSSAEEDVAITRLKNRHPSASERPRRDSNAGSRRRATSLNRGRSSSPSIRKLPPGAQAVVRGRPKGRSFNSERDDASSSPEPMPVPRRRNRDSRGSRRNMARSRDDSSSPEPEMDRLSARGSRRGGMPSASISRRSQSTRRSSRPPSPSSDSDESGPEKMRRSELRRSASRASRRSRRRDRGSPEPPMRRPSSRRLLEENEGFDPRRGRVALSRSRSYNSRRAASLAPPPTRNRRASYDGPERRRSSSRAPYQRRSYSQAPPMRRNFREEEHVERPKKRGLKALFGRFKKQEVRDDDDDDETSSLESVEHVRQPRDAPVIQDEELPPPGAMARQAPDVQNAVVDNYTVPKRETYANLYEYDNFPAIDRVPTAVGYQSDDSADEVYIGGAPVPVADDTSVTSRYSVDVRSVRSSKLKRHSGVEPGSDDDNDDKYSQYLSGNISDPIHSDDSDSCRPQWHHTLDMDDSDWYDDEDDEDGDMKKRSKQKGNKKYQVSGNKKKKATQEKGEPSAEEKGDAEVQEDERPGDAIVANRSEELEGNRVLRKKELEDAAGQDDGDENGNGNRRQRRRGGKAGRKNRFEEDETMVDDDDDDSYTEDHKAKGRKKHKFMKQRGIIMNTHGKEAPKASKKGKMKGFASRFRGFGKRNVGYGSDSDDSELSESIPITQNQSMFSEDPSSWQADPTLTKLEEDERRESTATHNMMRNNRKEITELDEMSQGSNQHQASCFPFSLGAMNLGTTSCFYPSNGYSDPNDIPLDDVQIQRLKDAKYDLENKPKVEVILQDLQDPLAEKYDQLEKAQRKKKSEMQQRREMQEETERREREELLRRKREMREMEQRKLQMLQHKDALALQEAPDLKRGKNQSFVMDISDWVLKLDNDAPRKSSAKDTPRTNGQDGTTDPVEKLPFSTIEVPTTTTIDSGDITESAAGSSWGGRRKNRHEKDYSQPDSHRRNKTNKPKNKKKKKGWFRRG